MLLCALMCLSSVNIIFICIIMFYQINSQYRQKSISNCSQICLECKAQRTLCSYLMFFDNEISTYKLPDYLFLDIAQ